MKGALRSVKQGEVNSEDLGKDTPLNPACDIWSEKLEISCEG